MTRTIACLFLAIGMVQDVLSFTPVVQSKNEIHKVKSVRVEDLHSNDDDVIINAKKTFTSSRREMMQKVIGTTATGTLVISGHAKMANALVSSTSTLYYMC